MNDKLAEHFAVIKAIDAASKKELKAIAGVESAINGLALPVPPQPGPVQYNPRRNRRNAGHSDFSSAGLAPQSERSTERKQEQDQAQTSVARAVQASAAMPRHNAMTVEIAPQEQTSKQESAAGEQLAQSKETNALLQGLYQDSQGYWRQQSGAFATRQQKEAATGKRDSEGDDSSLASRAMSWIKGKLLDDDSKNDAVDAAGVAAAGSEWMAFKEIKELAGQAREMLQEKGLDSKQGIKDKASRALSVARNPIKWIKGKLSSDQVAPTNQQEPLPAQGTKKPDSANPAESQAGKKSMLLNVLFGGRLGMAKGVLDKMLRRQGQPAANAEPQPRQAAEQSQDGAMTAQGRPARSGSLWRRLNPAPLFSHIGRRAMGKLSRADAAKQELQPADNSAIDTVNRSGGNSAKAARSSDNMAETLTDAIAEQTEALSAKLDRVEDAVKGIKAGGAGAGGDSLVDNALDLFGERRGRRGKKAPGRIGRAAGRFGSKLGSLVGMGVGTVGAIGAGSVGAGAGAAAGAGAKFGLAGAAKVGGAALSKLALPLTVAMAVYDGFKGFTDTEKQKETFKLKDDQEASLGQKSAMAAGSILSLGGLTDFIGVSGSDMASGLYKLFGGEIPDDSQSESSASNEAAPAEAAVSTKQSGAAPVSSPIALTSFSTAPLQSNGTATGPSPLMPGLSDGNYAQSAPDYAQAMPPIPADAMKAKGDNAPQVNVVAQTDPKLLKALEKLGAGSSKEVVSKSKETIRHQSERVTQQIPTGLSDNTMRMIAMDLL